VVKTECESQIKVLEAQLGNLRTAPKGDENIITQVVTALARIELLYHTRDMERKKQMVGSMFP